MKKSLITLLLICTIPLLYSCSNQQQIQTISSNNNQQTIESNQYQNYSYVRFNQDAKPLDLYYWGIVDNNEITRYYNGEQFGLTIKSCFPDRDYSYTVSTKEIYGFTIVNESDVIQEEIKYRQNH